MLNYGARLLFISILISALVAGCAPGTAAPAPTVLPAPPQVSSPAPTAKPTAKPTSTSLPPVLFMSSRFGYTITFPAGWQMQEIPGTWDGKTVAPEGDAGTDVFYKSNPEDGVPLEIGFLQVKPETTARDWERVQAARAKELAVCIANPKLESTTVGGEPALIQSLSCENHRVVNVYLVHANQGIYMNYAYANTLALPIFQKALLTFTFR